MPRKINKRKKLQAARRKAEGAAQPRPKRIGVIAHTPLGGSSLAVLAALAMIGSKRP